MHFVDFDVSFENVYHVFKNTFLNDGQDLNLSTERLTSNKAFTNKLWNAGKFILQNLPNQHETPAWENILAYKVMSNLSMVAFQEL